jgi:hypothetical protein
MAKDITFRHDRSNYLARVDNGQEFFVGKRVHYLENVGLENEVIVSGHVYKAENFRSEYDFWADFIEPTAICESKSSFECLNTYDRAAFTFGFLQFAAHVPGGDFVLWARSILGLPAAHDWFPDLTMENGKIHKITNQGGDQLEDNPSTQGLMDFLNPHRDAIDDSEVINAAKLIAWQNSSPILEESQVRIGIQMFVSNMKLYARKYNLNGSPDYICCVVADILHQGRGSSSQIMDALRETDKYGALLQIGPSDFRERCTTLKKEIDDRRTSNVFGRRVYSLSDENFVLR